MSTLGKVLIFFNLLVAGAFAYFSMQDYYGEKGKGNGRQAINAAGVRHVLLVDGLPLGTDEGDPTDLPSDNEAEIPFKVNLAGGFQTTTVSKKLIESYFASCPGDANLGGGAVPNQLAEVRRVKAKIDATYDGAERPDDKLKLLSGLLLWQPELYEEREVVLKLIAASDTAKLKELLDAKFKAVLDPPKSTVEAEALSKLTEAEQGDAAKQSDKVKKVDDSRAVPLDETERRAKLAHLLVHLSPDPDWQKRVAMVVGLKRFADTIMAQAQRFLTMAERVKLSLPADQATYLSHERIRLRRAIDQTDLANRQASLKSKWTDQEVKDANFLGVRGTQLKEIQARLSKTRAEVAEMLARQTNIEQALFEVQREVAITLDEVYRLEGVLEARERELLGLPPKKVAGGN